MSTFWRVGRRGRLFLFLLALAGPGAAALPGARAQLDAPLTRADLAGLTMDAWAVGRSSFMDGVPVVEIRLLGNEHTRDATILRELYLLPGEPYDSKVMARDLNFLAGLSLFASVKVELLPEGHGLVLVLHLIERGEIRWGLVYPVGDIEDGEIQAGLVYRNRSLFGGRESLWLEGSAGRETHLELRLARPWLGSRPLEHWLEYVRVERDDESELLVQRVGFGLWHSLNRRRPIESRILLRLIWGERSFRLDGAREEERQNSVAVGYSRDTRDSYLQPRGGGLFFLQGTYHGPLIGSSVELAQAHLWLRRYRELGLGLTGAFALESSSQWGALFYQGYSSLGGIDSVRGYGPRSVWGGYEEAAGEGPRGRNHVAVHLELRRVLFERFTFTLPWLGVMDVQGEGVLFADGGQLWSGDSPLIPSGGGIGVAGYGTGLRIFTPVGDVLRVEVALNDHGAPRAHLGSGLRF